MTRLLGAVCSVFGAENARYVVMDNNLFNLLVIAGPGVRSLLSERIDLKARLATLSEDPGASLPTDDWPYLYLTRRGIPSLYRTALFLLVFLSLGAVFVATPLRKGKIEPLFFFLGSGFLLLETKSVTTLSLLFGSTWVVNAVVFAAILAIALLANAWVGRGLPSHRAWVFGGLALSLIFLYFFPPGNLLKFGFAARAAFAACLTALPIFFSSILFAVSIRSVSEASPALGSNLLGAVLGGFLEYSSMAWGLNALYLVAFACYVAAAFCAARR